MVSGGFTMVSGGFRWFQVVSRWFQVVSDGFRSFQVVPCYSYHFHTLSGL